MTATRVRESYRMVQDSDGHWYVMPQSCATRFEELLGLGDQDRLALFNQYAIDGPSAVRIWKWDAR